MTELLLEGLPARHPAAALATFGLLVVNRPGTKLYFHEKKGTHYPVLVSEHTSVSRLASFLFKKETWEKVGLPPRKFDDTQILIKEFEEEFGYDPDHAAGVGTDFAIEDKAKDGWCATKTPFWFISRQTKHGSECTNLLSLLKIEQIETALSKQPWEKVFGQHYGFFPEEEIVKVYKNKDENAWDKLKTKSKAKCSVLTVPIISLLSLASWRLFPVFLTGRSRQGMTLGWVRSKEDKNAFVYPVFDRPVTINEFTAYIMNPELVEFRKNYQAWRKLGVSAVYQTKVNPGEKGGGNFQPSKTL